VLLEDALIVCFCAWNSTQIRILGCRTEVYVLWPEQPQWLSVLTVSLVDSPRRDGMGQTSCDLCTLIL
jgi:hypothetical protein